MRILGVALLIFVGTIVVIDAHADQPHYYVLLDPGNYRCYCNSYGVAYCETVTGYEGDAFTSTGRIEEDLLAITSVHPMRERAVRALLERTGTDWSVVHSLLEQGELVETRYSGHTYYVRRLKP